MSGRIKPGDLAITIKPRACGCGSGGTIFRVSKVTMSVGRIQCSECGALAPQQVAAYRDQDHCTPLWRVKRIPPIEELQTYRQTDETTV